MTNYNNSINQTIKGDFVGKEIFSNANGMVEYILQTTLESSENYNNAPFNEDDVENLYTDNSDDIEAKKVEIETLEENEEISDEERENQIDTLNEEIEELEEEQQERKEVYEWWIVSSYLADKLRKKGQVVIPHMNIWGRCATGQAILLDNVISEICEDMEILEGQEYSWERK